MSANLIGRTKPGCGTPTGYRNHYFRGERPCEECKREQYQRKRELRLFQRNPELRAQEVTNRTLARFEARWIAGPGGCYLWTGELSKTGYGVFKAGGRNRVAHRWYYQAKRGAIPSGLQLDHLCRVRRCVNPDHLEPVTPKENVARSAKAAQPTCRYGHPYTPENTSIIKSDGSRRCRQCSRDVSRRYYWRQAAKRGGVA